tara:strand:+ start:177 stop:485 length:309 start_codon:yes stop_codon:yes gene_type:complete
MKAIIKLQEVKLHNHGADVAFLDVELKAENELEFSSTFTLTSTGMSLRVLEDNSINEVRQLCEWLSKDSKNTSNLRDNASEIRLMAKNFIKMEKELKEGTTL